MSALELLQAMGAPAAQLQTARVLAAIVFVSLLVLLGLGLLRARRLLALHEADAALEADFRRLERAVAQKER